MLKQLISRSPQATAKFARDFAATLRGGEIITLSGPLGAGKTTFIQALAKALGVTEVVRSPSFLRLRVYKLKAISYKLRHFVHVDAYRTKTDHELIEAGIEEWFDRPDAVIAIEWPEKIKTLLRNKKLIQLTLTPGTGKTERIIFYRGETSIGS